MEVQNWFIVNTANEMPEIIISGFIGEREKADYSSFKTALNQLKANGHKEANVKLNSGGGDMMEGFSIYDAAKECGIKFNVQIVGMAASMATVLMFMGDDKPTISKHGRVMIHRPKAGVYGESDSLRTMADLADDMEEKVIELYVEKTGKKEAEVKTWMQPGKDKWFDAQEALAAGLVKKIVDSGEPAPKSAEPIKNETEQEVWEKVYNKIQLDNQNNTDMKLTAKTATELNLQVDASDSSIEAAVLALVKRATDAEAKATAAEAKITEMNAAQETELKTRANSLVDAAITAKKITADQKDAFVKMAVADYANTEKVLNSIKGATQINGKLKEGEVETGGEDRGKWTFEDYMKKDSKALENMQVAEPEKFSMLYEAYTKNSK